MDNCRNPGRTRSWATVALAAVLASAAPAAEASLTAYTFAGANLVRFQNGPVDVTLTADGNLLGTLLAGSANPAALIGSIIAASGGSIADAGYGTWTLTASDFGGDGSVNYFGARAFINYLNSTNYGGTNQWRLPGITDTGAAGCDFAFAGTDCGYNVAPGSGELARLYYSELGRTAAFDTTGSPTTGFGIFANDGAQTPAGAVGPFTNVRSDVYWAGLDYGPAPQAGWVFATFDGVQGFEGKEEKRYAWAVTPGQVVPVPAALWLFGSALAGLAGLRRARSA
jgi:hypothetical protein